MSFRLDRSPIKTYEELPDGRLRILATIARVGELKYLLPSGEFQTEYLTEDELFNPKWLDTIANSPVTLRHPEGKVNSDNWMQLAVGMGGGIPIPRPDKGRLDSVLTIGAREAIESIKSGNTTEVSPGYDTTLVSENGQIFQRDRIGNHIAIVELARGGHDVKLRFHGDSSDDWAVQVIDRVDSNDDEDDLKIPSFPVYFQIPKLQPKADKGTVEAPEQVEQTKQKESDMGMKKMMIDGKSWEMDEDLYDAIQGMMKGGSKKEKMACDATDSNYVQELAEAKAQSITLTAKADALQAEVDRLKVDAQTIATIKTELSQAQAKADTLQAELDRVKAESSTKHDAAQIEAEVRSRLTTWDQVRPFLGSEARFDAAASVIEMKRSAIAAASPALSLDGKDSAYIEAAFDVLVSTRSTEAKADAGNDDPLAGVLNGVLTAPRSDASNTSKWNPDAATKELTNRRLARSKAPVKASL